MLTSNEGRRYRASPNYPARFRSSDIIEFGSDKKVRHCITILGFVLTGTFHINRFCYYQAAFRVKVIRTTPSKNESNGKLLQAA